MSFWKNLNNSLKELSGGNGAISSTISQLLTGVDSLGSKLTGAHLTGAEQEANQFTHDERIDAQNWTAQREDTLMQRTMADYKAAGINPMMIAGGVGTASSSSGGQSVSPSPASLSDIMQLALLPAQKNLIDAQANAANASAAERTSKVPFWEASVDKARKSMELMNAQIETEGEKSKFYAARGLLANTSAENIVFLQDSIKKMNEASAANSQAQAAASLIEAAYKKGLIDSGYIEALTKQLNSESYRNYKEGKLAEYNSMLALAQEGKLKAETGKIITENEILDIEKAIKQGTFVHDYLLNPEFRDRVSGIEYYNKFAQLALGPVTDAIKAVGSFF